MDTLSYGVQNALGKQKTVYTDYLSHTRLFSSKLEKRDANMFATPRRSGEGVFARKKNSIHACSGRQPKSSLRLYTILRST